MTAILAGAVSRCKARWPQMRIVKVELRSATGFCKGPLEMLELLEGKLSRAVLRGLGGSNPTWLPGLGEGDLAWLPGGNGDRATE